MKSGPYFPLLAKVLGWLLLHLVILALAFVGFVGWQLGLGLDSLLSGSAGERLQTFGEAAKEEMINLPPPQWNAAIKPLAEKRKVTAGIFDFANPKNLNTNETNLMHLMITAYREQPSWPSYITDVQYLLMFPRRRSEVARAICAGGGGRKCVLQVFETLVKAAFIRSQIMGR